MKFKNKTECYNHFKTALEEKDIITEGLKEINYGLQFKVIVQGQSHTVRIYESKKNGVKIDLSQVKNSEIAGMLMAIAYDEHNAGGSERSESGEIVKDSLGEADKEENPLIGTDESGKGDYFGPLVIAGVYTDREGKAALRALGVQDSKKLKDSSIAVMAQEIKRICLYNSVVVLNNEEYNQLYANIKNLNRLLAWGHARVIEDVLEKTECKVALSDQFGNPSLIENALMEKGRQIHLEQRHRAEENVVVAAASILARNAFVEEMEKLEKRYGMQFPKGASNMTVAAARRFVERCGRENLVHVAKLHFKITPEL